MYSHLEQFLSYLTFEKRYSDHTILSYKNDISQLIQFIESQYEIDIQGLTHFHIRSWVVQLIQNKNSEKSINRKISTIRSFFKYLRRQKVLTVNPSAKVKAPKIPKRINEHVHEDEMANALDIIHWGNTPFLHLRNRLIFELLYSAGLRRSELIELKDIDIDIQNKIMKVIGKGNKARLIPLVPNVVVLCKEYFKERDQTFDEKDAFTFLTEKGKKMYPKLVYNIIRQKLSIVTKIKKKSPHVLRHSFATHLSNNGAEINAIKDLLGHSSLAATQIYTQNSIKKLKKAHEAHPRYNA